MYRVKVSTHYRVVIKDGKLTPTVVKAHARLFHHEGNAYAYAETLPYSLWKPGLVTIERIDTNG